MVKDNDLYDASDDEIGAHYEKKDEKTTKFLGSLSALLEKLNEHLDDEMFDF